MALGSGVTVLSADEDDEDEDEDEDEDAGSLEDEEDDALAEGAAGGSVLLQETNAKTNRSNESINSKQRLVFIKISLRIK